MRRSSSTGSACVKMAAMMSGGLAGASASLIFLIRAMATRVHAYRPHPAGDTVVLLTGAGFNASGWYPHVAALAEDGPVYGIDMPGDPNPSVARALMTPPENCAAWLDELLGKLSDRPAPGEVSCRMRRLPSSPAATAASTGSTS